MERPQGEDHDGVLTLGQGCGEAVEEDLHRVGIDRGQDQREGGLAAGPGGAKEGGPFVALVLNSGRALAARPPAMTEPPLLADAHLVLEPGDHEEVWGGHAARA